MSTSKVEKVQNVCRLLLDEFARKCNKEGLRWFIDAGSLLGVIRHGGFIPWDDDIDIVMPRKDYNFLYENGKTIFKEPFCMLTSKNNKADTLTIKLCYNDSTFITTRDLTYFYRSDGHTFNIPNGIKIDIVPIDHVPDNFDDRKKLRRWITYLYDTCIDVGDYNSKNNTQRINALYRFNEGAQIYNEVMTDIDEQNNKIIACTPWWIFNNSINSFVESKCYDGYFEKTFDGCEEKVRVPIGYDDILKSYYKDYMIEKPRDTDWSDRLIDDKKSYKYYEQYTNEELLEMIKKGA